MNRPHHHDDKTGPLSWPVRRPWVTLLVAVAIVAAAIALIQTMQTDGTLGAMLPEHDSSSAALAQIGESFDAANEITLLVTLPESAADDATPLLHFSDRLVDALVHNDHSALISNIAVRWTDDAEAWVREAVVPNLLLYLEDDQREAFARRMSPVGMAEQFRMTERAAAAPGVAGSALRPLLDDPLRLREFVRGFYDDLPADAAAPGEPMLSADGRSLMVRLNPANTNLDAAQTRAIMDLVRACISEANPGDVRVRIAGGPAIAEAAERSIRSDMIASSIGTVVLLQLLFLLTYRRLIIFPLALLPAAAGIVVGFGVFALTGRSISPPTAVIGALLAGLGVDYAIHYLAHHRDDAPLSRTSRRLFAPLVMAGVTSIIAFGTIGLSDVTALRDFATLGAVGLTATLLATLTLLPALLALTQRRVRGETSHRVDAPRWHLDRVVQYAVAHSRSGLGLSVAATLAALLLLFLLPGGPVRFDTDLRAMHPAPNAPLDAQQALGVAFPGQADALLLYITADSEAELIERAAQCRARLQASRQAKPYIDSVVGVDRFLPAEKDRADRREFAEQFDHEGVLTNFDQAVKASVFDPAYFASYRDYLAEILRANSGPSLSTLYGYNELAKPFLPTNDVQDGKRHFALTHIALAHPLDNRPERDAAIHAIRDALGDLPGVTLSGMPVVGHDIERTVREDLSRLLLVAGVAVTVWLLICFRSPRDTAAALLPVSGGLLMLFAVMLVAGVGLNLINLIALPLLAGLGVDDGVFLVSIARRARRQTLRRAELIQELTASAQAISLTSMTTALAFGSLTFTAVPAIRSLGIVMAVGIAACLLLSVFALAPLLVMMHTTDANPATALPHDNRPGAQV